MAVSWEKFAVIQKGGIPRRFASSAGKKFQCWSKGRRRRVWWEWVREASVHVWDGLHMHRPSKHSSETELVRMQNANWENLKKNAHQQCCCCCDGDDDSLLCSSSRTHFFLDLFQASEFRSLDLWLCLWQAWTDGQSECSRLPCIHRWSIWCLAAAICLHCTDNHLSALCAHLIMYAWWFWVFPCWNCPG